MTDERIVEIGKRYFREGHKPESVHFFVAAVRAVLAECVSLWPDEDAPEIQMATPRKVELTFRTAAAAEEFVVSIAKDSK